MNHTFEFYLNNIHKKFVQRYVDKLLSLGYDREIGSNNELIILTSPESQS